MVIILAANLELVSHSTATNNHTDPKDQRQTTAESGCQRYPAGQIPLRRPLIENRLTHCSIDTQHQQKDHLRAEERIRIGIFGLGHEQKTACNKHSDKSDPRPTQKLIYDLGCWSAPKPQPKQTEIKDENHADRRWDGQNVAALNDGEQPI